MPYRVERAELFSLANEIFPEYFTLDEVFAVAGRITENTLRQIQATLQAENLQGLPVAVGNPTSRRPVRKPATAQEFLENGFSIVGPWQKKSIDPDNPDFGEVEFTPELFLALQSQIARTKGLAERSVMTEIDRRRFPDTTTVDYDSIPRQYHTNDYNASTITTLANGSSWIMPPHLTLTKDKKGVIGMTTTIVTGYSLHNDSSDAPLITSGSAEEQEGRIVTIQLESITDAIQGLIRSKAEIGARKVLAKIPPYKK